MEETINMVKEIYPELSAKYFWRLRRILDYSARIRAHERGRQSAKAAKVARELDAFADRTRQWALPTN